MKKLFPFLLAVFVASGLLGCGKKTASIAAKSKAFDGAPVTVRETWNAAVARAGTNDYAGASGLLVGLRRQQLTPAQTEAVESALTTVMETVYAAAERGDPAAKAAIEEMKKRGRR